MHPCATRQPAASAEKNRARSPANAAEYIFPYTHQIPGVECARPVALLQQRRTGQGAAFCVAYKAILLRPTLMLLHDALPFRPKAGGGGGGVPFIELYIICVHMWPKSMGGGSRRDLNYSRVALTAPTHPPHMSLFVSEFATVAVCERSECTCRRAAHGTRRPCCSRALCVQAEITHNRYFN